jgi:hypothetical protein
MKQEYGMTTKTVAFTPGRVYCVNLDHDDGMQPKLVKYHGPEQPWENVCSGVWERFEVDAIDDAIEVPPVIVHAIALANRTDEEDAQSARTDDDDAPAMWEHDVYWDD